MKLLVTGGAGFIGSNFIHYILKTYPHYKIINLDKLTYAGNLENLKDIQQLENYTFVKGDIADSNIVNNIVSQGIDAIVNFAAETHVDRSIDDPSQFIYTNIVGTYILLEACKLYNVKKFIQISTDEVYGSLDEKGFFTENTPLAPNSPYSASKASADLLAYSYFKTFSLPIIITRSSNNYGPYQFPEKFIPLFITNALEDKSLPLYGDGKNVRDWLFVEDNVRGIDLILHKGKIGEVYNIGGECEKENIEVAKEILQILGKPYSLIKFVKDRPGHDRRYAMDISKIKNEFGWVPKDSFHENLKLTIKWYIENQRWWKNIKNGSYKEYYKKMYENR